MQDELFIPLDKQGNPIQVLSFLESQTLATDEVSAIFDADFIKVVRLVAIGDVWVSVGENPTAAENTSALLPDGTIEYIAVYQGNKISVTGGSLNITITK